MTTNNENNTAESPDIKVRWLTLYHSLTQRLDHMDQVTEMVFLDIGRRLGGLVKSCKDVIEMTHQATVTLSKRETVQAAELLIDKEAIPDLHGLMMDFVFCEKSASAYGRSMNYLHELSDLLTNLDKKTSPMTEKVMVMSKVLSNRMNMIVEAVQFQDITRQQIDKVRESLGNLSKRATRFPDEKEVTVEGTVGFLIDVTETCDIQGRRIEGVAGQISDAWSSIHNSLVVSGEEILNAGIIMSSLAQMVQEIPYEIKKLVKRHEVSDPGPEIGQEPDTSHKEFAVLSKAIQSGSVKILSISRIVEEKAHSISQEIRELENVFIEDHDISGTLEHMVRDLHEMTAFSRTTASSLMPEGQELLDWTVEKQGTISRREDPQLGEEKDNGSGSVELF